MKRTTLLLSLCLGLSSTCWGQSKTLNFDFGWKFMEKDVVNAQLAKLDDSQENQPSGNSIMMENRERNISKPIISLTMELIVAMWI